MKQFIYSGTLVVGKLVRTIIKLLLHIRVHTYTTIFTVHNIHFLILSCKTLLLAGSVNFIGKIWHGNLIINAVRNYVGLNMRWRGNHLLR